MPVLPPIVQRLILDPSGYLAGTRAAQTGITGLGVTMTRIGSRLSKFVTLPLLGVGIASVNVASDFQSSMNKIEALVGATSKQMKMFEKQIIAMGPRVGRAPRELAEALYFITSSGFDAAEAMTILRASAKASAAGLGSTQIVADAVTSAMNAYKSSALTASQATDILIAAVREGKAEPEELAYSIGRVIGPAQILGVTFDQVTGSVAAMTLSGLNAYEAVTALRGIIRAIQDPSAQAAKKLKAAGLSMNSVRDDIKQRGLLDALITLRGELDKHGIVYTDVFENIRAFNGFTLLTQGNLEKTREVFAGTNAAIRGESKDTEKAFRVVQKTLKQTFNETLAALENAAIKIAPPLFEALEDIAVGIKNVARWFERLPKPVQTNIVKFGLLAAATGPVLWFFGAILGRVRNAGVLFVDFAKVIGRMVVNLIHGKTAFYGFYAQEKVLQQQAIQTTAALTAQERGVMKLLTTTQAAGATSAKAGISMAGFKTALSNTALAAGIAVIALGPLGDEIDNVTGKIPGLSGAIKGALIGLPFGAPGVIVGAIGGSLVDSLTTIFSGDDLPRFVADLWKQMERSAQFQAKKGLNIGGFDAASQFVRSQVQATGNLKGVEGALRSAGRSWKTYINAVRGGPEVFEDFLWSVRATGTVTEKQMALLEGAGLQARGSYEKVGRDIVASLQKVENQAVRSAIAAGNVDKVKEAVKAASTEFVEAAKRYGAASPQAEGALKRLAANARGVALATLAATDSAPAAMAALREQRAAFVELATFMGLNEVQARSWSNAYIDMPDKILKVGLAAGDAASFLVTLAGAHALATSTVSLFKSSHQNSLPPIQSLLSVYAPLAQDVRTYAQALVKASGNNEDGRKAIDSSIASLKGQLIAMNYSEEEADIYARRLLQIPANVDTLFDFDGKEANRRLDEVKRKVLEINGIKIKIGDGISKEELDKIKSGIQNGLLDPNTLPKAAIRAVFKEDEFRAEWGHMVPNLEAILNAKKPKAKATLDVQVAGLGKELGRKVEAGVAAVRDKVKGLNNLKGSPKIEADKHVFNTRVAKANQELDLLHGSSASPKLKAEAAYASQFSTLRGKMLAVSRSYASPGLGSKPGSAHFSRDPQPWRLGGLVPGPINQRVPAFLHGGEYVLPANIVQAIAQGVRISQVPTSNPAVPNLGALGGPSSTAYDNSRTVQQTNYISAFDPRVVAEHVARETSWALRTSGKT